MSVPVQNVHVATGDNRRRCEILVVGNRRWNKTGEDEFFTYGFPFVFEFLPSLFATPIYLGVTQQDEYSQACQPQKKPEKIAPALADPADKNHQTKQRRCTNDAENDHGKTFRVIRQRIVGPR